MGKIDWESLFVSGALAALVLVGLCFFAMLFITLLVIAQATIALVYWAGMGFIFGALTWVFYKYGAE